ncbi:MAG: translation elongation factor Ts [Nitrospirae bacterium GWD2_57_9]|nr:MAG: translation elongation factor Ts [Nitrospirae bacterium GWD2_57_9]OGW45479.1 MAG: translation elongation factor Ts [Nitrospirae bacterium GWC2_57_9]
MATISASAVKDLREKTGVGMMEAKKALEEAGGDFEKAVDILRKKGLSAAAKKSARVASEGMIASRLENAGKTAVLIEVNSETDFVSKNEEFQSFAKGLAEIVVKQKPADVAALSQLSIGGDNVEAKRNALVQKIGENISIRRFAVFETSGQVAVYLHGNRIGVMVDYTGGDEQLGKDLAMHIAAASPQFLSREAVPADVLARERSVYEAQAKESGKPAAVIGKIVEGKLEKFFSDSCLVDQVYIKDPDGKLKIKDLLKKAGATVNRFTRYQLGEGIEKKKENFADEVAAQLK